MILLLFLILAGSFGLHPRYVDLALKKCTSADEWSIHGLWPEFNSTIWPQFCNQTKCKEFDMTALWPIRDQLEKYWFSCPPSFLGPNEDFWKHEWCKHATCMPTSQNMFRYFSTTLFLFQAALQSQYFGCCASANDTCLIHFNETTWQWLGYCE